jgi:formylglycine-generating enzyme required for sulfatase activity
MRIVSVRTVFLSSTGADLRDYRVKAFEAIQKLDHWKCVRMEDFGARDWAVDTFCREKVAECDLFIGIIGHRFGDGPKGSRESFTHREYRAAAKKARLMFMSPDDFPVPANLLEPMWKIREQLKFRKELRTSKEEIPSIAFSSPDHLATQIVTGIYHWDRERSGKPEGVDTRPYLEALWEETAYIDIRGLRVANEAVHRFRIDELYTPLTTVLAAAEDKKTPELTLHEQRTIPLQQALENRRVVLVGDPGAGKSTFLRRIAFAACDTLLGRNPLAAEGLIAGKPCPLPLLIRAAALADYIHAGKGLFQNDSPDWISHYLHHEMKLDAAFFREQLDAGCLLLLDGLDEVPDSIGRKAITRLLDRAARTYKNTLIVATSRPPAYGGETVIPGFVTIQIGPLERGAIETFVANWCRALHRDETELLDAIRSRPEIEALAVNPVMLTALAALHWNRTRLPDQRSELYESVLSWLAQAREEARKGKSSGLSPVECLGLMQHLAWAMHSDAKGRQTEITRLAAARILAPRFRSVAEDEQLAAAERFLEEEETDSGILVSRGNMLRFWHLTFQEYLAAKALARRDADRRKLLFKEGKLYLPEWRETVLLLAGVLCKEDVDSVDAFFHEVLDGLGPSPSLAHRARCVGLIGSMLRDLKSWGYRIADPRYQDNLDRVLAIFEAEAARTIDFQTRLEAADALGQAGDPRFERDNWVLVTGGRFWMGAQTTDPNGMNYDPAAMDDELPVHLVELPAFEMARYPVTVTEYARFVDAGGYGKEELWRAGAYGALTEPKDWQAQLRYPNRPVVSVSWYEAMAYCSWTGTRLPAEEEWECAGRGGRESVRYPWGNQEPNVSRANFEDKPGHPTPVGLYPDGAAPGGIEDMAGNVFEWMADSWHDYHSERQASEIITNTRVIRGGAWPYSSRLLRVSYRNSFQPAVGDVDLGFRCVRSPRDTA